MYAPKYIAVEALVFDKVSLASEEGKSEVPIPTLPELSILSLSEPPARATKLLPTAPTLTLLVVVVPSSKLK